MGWLLPNMRALTDAEIQLAKSVFLETIPYHLVRIDDDLGLGGAPWTESNLSGYDIHFGPMGYAGATSSTTMPNFGVIRDIFIHEMTHVWQGAHSSFHEGYMIKSAASQVWGWATKSDAYAYTPGKSWDDYNVEQQAHLVEDWFHGGMQTPTSTTATFKVRFAASRTGGRTDRRRPNSVTCSDERASSATVGNTRMDRAAWGRAWELRPRWRGRMSELPARLLHLWIAKRSAAYRMVRSQPENKANDFPQALLDGPRGGQCECMEVVK